MPVLRRLLRAELRKTLSTNAWWVLLAAAALLTALMWAIDALAFVALLLLPKFPVVYGVICASGEFRYRTISTSYLAAPHRGRLLTAKLLVAMAVGAVYALVCALTCLPWLLLEKTNLSTGDMLGVLLGVGGAAMLTFALWSALGVGLGMLIKNQATAVVGVLVCLVLIEPITAMAASLGDRHTVMYYLPTGLVANAFTSLALGRWIPGLTESVLPSWWLALLIFAGYTTLAVVAGAAVARRRDIS